MWTEDSCMIKIANDPKDKKAILRLAEIHFEGKKFDDALKLLV